jgi:glycosyltransferase involved in cell wall biosynthesis
MNVNFRPSVIIPTYNYARYLSEALDSVLAQTLSPHEIIVIDDGSTDHTAEIAARYARRITYIQQANRGVPAARNSGIARATGNWLAFLDADDLWEPDFLERVAPVCASRPRPALVFTDFRTFGTNAAIHRVSSQFAAWNPTDHLLSPFASIMPSAALVSADVPIRFHEWALANQDAMYFNEVAETGPIRCVAEPLMRHRLHPASIQAHGSRVPYLLHWAKGREAVRPGTIARLFRTLAHLTLVARWKRDWSQYWMLREHCNAHWPPELARPSVLTERLWPRALYRAKDAWDHLRTSRSIARSD